MGDDTIGRIGILGVQFLARFDIDVSIQWGRFSRANGEDEMNNRLSLSIFTIEVDGKPTLAFGAKRYSEAEAICGDEQPLTRLSSLKSSGVPLCGDNAVLNVRLAHPDEAARYEQAVGAPQSTDDLLLVYLVELDGPE